METGGENTASGKNGIFRTTGRNPWTAESVIDRAFRKISSENS
jgi:hypothetical protein